MGHLFASNEDNSRNRDVFAYIPVVFILFFLIIITRRAWLSDDAYITFRTVDNLVHGYRLTWNTSERVQAYTHPLWMFLLSGVYALTHNMYMTGIGLSLVVSLAVVLVFVFRVSKSIAGSILGLTVFTFSGAYVNYATSGLENPLSHLLLVIFFVVYYRRPRWDLLKLTLIVALAGVTRLDLLLVYFPLLLFRFLENISSTNVLKRFIMVVVGGLPLVFWELFSLFYYGFLFPNTAFAKLNTGIPGDILVKQGLNYLWNSLQYDPLTLLVIICCVVLAFVVSEFRNDREKKHWWLNLHLPAAIGILLYLGYIVKIGGDFMSGRFLTPLVLIAVIIISRIRYEDFHSPKGQWRVFMAIMAMILVVGIVISPYPTYRLQIPDGYPLVDEFGIADERAWYFDDLGFLNVLAKGGEPVLEAKSKALGIRVEAEGDMLIQVMGNTGVFGFYAGPNVYIIDQYALSEPLLARLPAVREIDWRVGHYRRIIPDGYIAKIYGLGEIADSRLAQFYEKLSLIIRGELSDISRLSEIWRMNTGMYSDLIDTDAYRYPGMVITSMEMLESLSDPVVGRTNGESKDRIHFTDSGISIILENIQYADRMGICMEMDDEYQLEFWNGSRKIADTIRAPSGSSDELVCYYVPVPAKAVKLGYDQIRIFPLAGNDVYSIGHLRLIVGD